MTDARLLDDMSNSNNPPFEMLTNASAANTAAATSGNGQWLDVRSFEGDLIIIQAVGAVTAGSITGKLQSAADANGGSAADISGATFTQATAHGVQAIALDKGLLPAGSPFVGYVGTIVTGPAVVGVVALGRKKYS